MSLDRIHLRKLLKILFLDAGPRRSALRGDIREEIARNAGEVGSGGDFYAPFWFDAKSHVFGTVDLHTCVDDRIAANAGRANLYPLLRDGFLLWWNERRRWTNEPFRPGQTLKAQFPFPGLDATVKVDSLLSVRDSGDAEHFVYPYFAPSPALSEEAARWGLWLLAQALPTVEIAELRILDVIRGRTFSIDRTPLRGDEEQNFRRRYAAVLQERETLRREYD
ncbi:MAG TPA: hypothetical protein VF680_08025 [Allosphingosinicella sp.]|jgi:hypothetical protein